MNVENSPSSSVPTVTHQTTNILFLIFKKCNSLKVMNSPQKKKPSFRGLFNSKKLSKCHLLKRRRAFHTVGNQFKCGVACPAAQSVPQCLQLNASSFPSIQIHKKLSDRGSFFNCSNCGINWCHFPSLFNEVIIH